MNSHSIDAIPIEFIDKMIDRYKTLFDHSLYELDQYDEKYRMMIDSLELLKKRWKHENGKRV